MFPMTKNFISAFFLKSCLCHLLPSFYPRTPSKKVGDSVIAPVWLFVRLFVSLSHFLVTSIPLSVFILCIFFYILLSHSIGFRILIIKNGTRTGRISVRKYVTSTPFVHFISIHYCRTVYVDAQLGLRILFFYSWDQ